MDKQQFDFHVSLRATHPTLDPTSIAAGLDLKPNHSWTAGEPRVTPTGTPLGGVRNESYCTFDLGSGKDGEVARCLRSALSHLKQHKDFLRRMNSDGGSLRFYVFWHPNGDTGEVFPTSMLKDKGDLGIELGINVLEDHLSN